MIGRRTGWLLIGFGVWSWIIWPTFLRNIWADKRSWHHGATSFFLIHLALTVVSLVLGTAIGALGWRALRADAASTNVEGPLSQRARRARPAKVG